MVQRARANCTTRQSGTSFLTIIIIACCAIRRIWPSHYPPNSGLATSQLFHPASLLSLSTVLFQMVFSLPLALRPSGVHPSAVKQSFTPSLLSTRPNQFHLLRTSQLISLISAISITSLVYHSLLPSNSQYTS